MTFGLGSRSGGWNSWVHEEERAQVSAGIRSSFSFSCEMMRRNMRILCFDEHLTGDGGGGQEMDGGAQSGGITEEQKQGGGMFVLGRRRGRTCTFRKDFAPFLHPTISSHPGFRRLDPSLTTTEASPPDDRGTCGSPPPSQWGGGVINVSVSGAPQQL